MSRWNDALFGIGPGAGQFQTAPENVNVPKMKNTEQRKKGFDEAQFDIDTFDEDNTAIEIILGVK